MPRQTRPRAEDPNAESRTQVPGVTIPTAPPPPRPPSATGGASKPQTGGGDPPYVPQTGGGLPPFVPQTGGGLPPVKPPAPWWRPDRPWQQQPINPPTTPSGVTNPQWKLKDVAANEAAFVQEFKKLLWEKYQATPEAQRGGVFWQGVKQNPEMAAASFVRRALQNMSDANKVMNGESPPRLDQALRTTMANNETRQWLEWVRGRGRMPGGA